MPKNREYGQIVQIPSLLLSFHSNGSISPIPYNFVNLVDHSVASAGVVDSLSGFESALNAPGYSGLNPVLSSALARYLLGVTIRNIFPMPYWPFLF